MHGDVGDGPIRDGGPADHHHGVEVDAGQVAHEACSRWHRNDHELGEAPSCHRPGHQSVGRHRLVVCFLHGGKLAQHAFPDKGSDADEALVVVHIDLFGPFRVAAKDDSLYFLLLKDRKTRFVWVRPVTKNSNVLQEFEKWLLVAERQTKKSVLMLHSDRGGEFFEKHFIDFVNSKGNVHNLTCPYTPQQNGMAEREMRMVVGSLKIMLLHMGVQHH
ncbi:unnamed protein product [Closterium sp. NIES-54]